MSSLTPSVRRQPCGFDWFLGFNALRLLIRTTLTRKRLVLQIGCGNSTLQEGMAKDGYTIVNVSRGIHRPNPHVASCLVHWIEGTRHGSPSGGSHGPPHMTVVIRLCPCTCLPSLPWDSMPLALCPVQTDIASSVINQMRERHKDLPKLTYMVRRAAGGEYEDSRSEVSLRLSGS